MRTVATIGVYGFSCATFLDALQYREDARAGVGKRSRIELAPEYAARYVNEILDTAATCASSRITVRGQPRL